MFKKLRQYFCKHNYVNQEIKMIIDFNYEPFIVTVYVCSKCDKYKHANFHYLKNRK
jgi:hypothetical protein